MQPFLADPQLVYERCSSPIVTVGNVLDLLVTDCVNRQTAVFVSDVCDDIINPAAGANRLNPLTKSEDWLPLVSVTEVIGVDCHNDLAVLRALLKEPCVSVVEQVKRPADVDPAHGRIVGAFFFAFSL